MLEIPEISQDICPKENYEPEKKYIYTSIFTIRTIWNLIDFLLLSNTMHLPQISKCEEGKIKEKKTEIKINNETKETNERNFISCKNHQDIIDGKIYISNNEFIPSEVWFSQKGEFIRRYTFIKNGHIKFIPANYQGLMYGIRNLLIYSFIDFSSVLNEKLLYLHGSVAIKPPYSIYYKGDYKEYIPKEEQYYMINFQKLKIDLAIQEGSFSVSGESELSITSKIACGNFKLKSDNINVSPLAAFSYDPCGYEGKIEINEYSISISNQSIHFGDKKIFCFELFE